ncbi:MAG: hypothetical protein HC851_10340 [Acaryochloris sp. RU_4_1]|nr:hypothetical protein [Acaryochloris sp. SU_5_25]NJM66024.1 hypothetical protein [Acaryochloris sp. RU_4_1]NJR53761.1 hypothetical protein [Acaryochloris sp. CRU_2_0]
MTGKNWSVGLPTTTVATLASLVGLMTLGCTLSPTSQEQPPTQTKNKGFPEVSEGAKGATNNTTPQGASTPVDTTPQNSSSHSIAEGFYALGGTDQGLEVAGKQYRYFDELGTKPWMPISDLKHVKKGVLLDGGETYWCLSTLAPKNEAAICSAEGWKRHQDIQAQDNPKTEAKPSQISENELVLAGIALGDPESKVFSKLGSPDRVVDGNPSDDQLEYPDLTLWVSEERRVTNMRSTSDQHCTPAGVCPGMQFSRVREIYGSPLVADRENGRFMEYGVSQSSCWLQIALDDQIVKSVGVACQP